MTFVLIKNIGRLYTCAGGALPRRRERMRDTGEIENAFVLVNADSGKIAESGLGEPHDADSSMEIVDAGGRVVIPGLVDPHTHPVYAGNRAGEFYLRAAGKTYLEISAAGGGINASVGPTRSAAPDTLLACGFKNAWDFLFHGTTLFEAKSGYGLSLESELAMLEAIRVLAQKVPQEVVPTFLGAHAIPADYAGMRAEYLDFVCGEMLAEVASRGLAEYVDVFIEEGAYTAEEGERVITAAKARGLGVRIHADEFTDKGAAALGAKYKAASVDHLGAISGEGIRALAECDTVAVLMPGTIFFIGSEGYAPARKLIDSGAAVALASDHNPGSSMIYGMPFVMSLAVLKMNMTAEECLVASTINAAYSLGRADRKGSIEPGKDADLVILDAPSLDDLPYRIGANIVKDVMIRGRWVKREHNMILPRPA